MRLRSEGNEARAHVLDGVAVTKLIKWLKDTAETDPKTEISVSAKAEGAETEQR